MVHWEATFWLFLYDLARLLILSWLDPVYMSLKVNTSSFDLRPGQQVIISSCGGRERFNNSVCVCLCVSKREKEAERGRHEEWPYLPTFIHARVFDWMIFKLIREIGGKQSTGHHANRYAHTVSFLKIHLKIQLANNIYQMWDIDSWLNLSLPIFGISLIKFYLK